MLWQVFDKWNANLSWRLLENTADILRSKDENGDLNVEFPLLNDL